MKTFVAQMLRRCESHSAEALELIRIYLGVGLFVKAIYIMGNREFFLDLLHKSDNVLFASATVLHFVIPLHLVGGALLAFGLLTRVAAVVQIPVVAGALFLSTQSVNLAFDMRQSFELSALVLFLLVLIAIFGPGRWSVDSHLIRAEPKSRKETAKVAA